MTVRREPANGMKSAAQFHERHAIGIDVGGSKIALGIVSADGTVSGFHRINNSDASDFAVLLENVSAVVGHLRAELDLDMRETLGIGVATCELVGTDGEIGSATSIPWTRADVLNALSPFGRVTLESDVRASALAEAQLGAGRAFESFVHMTVGTGISCCLVRAGVPDAGTHGFAGLIGSTPLTIPLVSGNANMTLTLEDVASGPALSQSYSKRASDSVGFAEHVLALADRGDQVASAVIDEAATMLGSFVALLVNVFDPEAVVVGGGLGSAGGRYWDITVSATRARIWADPARSLPVLQASFGPNAALVGAGLVAMAQT